MQPTPTLSGQNPPGTTLGQVALARRRAAVRTIAIIYCISVAIIVLFLLAAFVYAGFTLGWVDARNQVFGMGPILLVDLTLVFFLTPVAIILVNRVLVWFFSRKAAIRSFAWLVQHPLVLKYFHALLGFDQREVKTDDGDTRVKVLVGTACLADAATHDDTKSTVQAILERAVLDPTDREVLKAAGWLR